MVMRSTQKLDCSNKGRDNFTTYYTVLINLSLREQKLETFNYQKQRFASGKNLEFNESDPYRLQCTFGH